MKYTRRVVEEACWLLSAGAFGEHVGAAAQALDVSPAAIALADRAYYEVRTPQWMLDDDECEYEEWCALAESELRSGWRPS